MLPPHHPFIRSRVPIPESNRQSCRQLERPQRPGELRPFYSGVYARQLAGSLRYTLIH